MVDSAFGSQVVLGSHYKGYDHADQSLLLSGELSAGQCGFARPVRLRREADGDPDELAVSYTSLNWA